MFDRTFWVLFLFIAIFGTSIWLAIFEYNYHRRIYRYSEQVTVLQVENSELDLNHPDGKRLSLGEQNEEIVDR